MPAAATTSQPTRTEAPPSDASEVPDTEQSFDPRKQIETWEATTGGTVWVWVTDARQGGYRKQRVGGSAGGSRRLRISVDDRRFNEEQMVEEMMQHNPFRNGLLRLVSSQRADDIDDTYHLSDEDLAQVLDLRDMDLFESEIKDMGSELVVRRLKSIAESRGTVAQNQIINDIIEAKGWKLGGTQRTVRELTSEDVNLGTPLS